LYEPLISTVVVVAVIVVVAVDVAETTVAVAEVVDHRTEGGTLYDHPDQRDHQDPQRRCEVCIGSSG
jgi:hypothetical protein